MVFFGGHIGDRASALVDGQLSQAEQERAWKHVLGCPGCRRAVEREGWIKSRLASLSSPASLAAPPSLMGALYDVDAWAAVDAIERRAGRRRAVGALVGAGSVSLAVVAMMAVTSPPAGRGEIPGRAGRVGPASITPGAVLPSRWPEPVGADTEVGAGLTADIANVSLGGASR